VEGGERRGGRGVASEALALIGGGDAMARRRGGEAAWQRWAQCHGTAAGAASEKVVVMGGGDASGSAVLRDRRRMGSWRRGDSAR
jgi:hypothetical protein